MDNFIPPLLDTFRPPLTVVKITKNHRQNRLLVVHYGSKYPLHPMSALFSNSRTQSAELRLKDSDIIDPVYGDIPNRKS